MKKTMDRWNGPRRQERHLRAAAAVLALACAQASGFAQSQHAVFFRGLPGSFGHLEQFDLGAALPAAQPLGQAPVRLLPLETNGRTELSRGDPSVPWRYDDVPAASRIRLPAGRGSLYHHEQDLGGGARAFGFFIVDASGGVRLLIERKGTGPLHDQNPFHGRVGGSRDGRSILCATTLAAGGDLLEIDLDSGVVSDRTATLPASDWLPQSLHLGPKFGIAMHTQGAASFRRDPGALAVPLAFPAPAPTWFSGEVALAARGTFAAFVAGSTALTADVYVLSVDGLLARATTQPAAISPAGYLPEQIDGPFLAVADDGSACAWRTEGTTREAFLARVPWQSTPVSAQLTADTLFTDTIDEVGQFGFRPNGGFVFTAGERDLAAGGVDKIDIFRAVLPAGAPTPTLQNLSMSSGVLNPPYLVPGTIRPEGALDMAGAGGRLLLDSDQEELVWMASGGGAGQVLLADVKSFEGVEFSGGTWVLSLRRSSGNQPRQLHLWDGNPANALQLRHSTTSADGFESVSVRGSRLAFYERNLTTLELRAGDLTSGTLFPFPVQTPGFGPGIALGANGQVLVGLGAPPAAAVLVRWQPGSTPRRAGTASGPGFVLAGL